MSDAADSPATAPRQRYVPAIGPRLRLLLLAVFALFALLVVNSVYLVSVTLIEWISENTYQDYFYQLNFLLHLVLGLLIIPTVIIFGIAHIRNAWRRPNRRAVHAGLALYTTALLLLVSGLILVRFDFFSVKDPVLRGGAYWTHIATPLIAAWLFEKNEGQ